MTGKKFTIKLTQDQQKQIKDATGQSIAELNINIGPAALSEEDLEKVAGGAFDTYLQFKSI